MIFLVFVYVSRRVDITQQAGRDCSLPAVTLPDVPLTRCPFFRRQPLAATGRALLHLWVCRYWERRRVQPASKDDGAIVSPDAVPVLRIRAQAGLRKRCDIRSDGHSRESLREQRVGSPLDREAGLVV